MNKREREVTRWFRPWKARGYTLSWLPSGHRGVHDRAGRLVTVMSSTPTNPRAARENTERILRRHHKETK